MGVFYYPGPQGELVLKTKDLASTSRRGAFNAGAYGPWIGESQSPHGGIYNATLQPGGGNFETDANNLLAGNWVGANIHSSEADEHSCSEVKCEVSQFLPQLTPPVEHTL